jgi:hypothetical protein
MILRRSIAILMLVFSDKGWSKFWDLVLAAGLWEGAGGSD